MKKFSKKLSILFFEWSRYGDEDLEMVRLALQEDGPPNQICFHAQQAAEKYLKGYIVATGAQFAKTHQLRYLLELCCVNDMSFAELKEDAIFLTQFYIETRYPGDIPEFTKKQARLAEKATLRIKEFVLKRV